MKISIAGVCERDLDLFLLEEFLSNVRFLQWFASAAGVGTNASLLEIRRSVTQTNGESDLELTLQSSEGNRVRLLIENKVNASFQPQQAERYRARAEGYVKAGHCVAARTVLIAPHRYLRDSLANKGFDVSISYEDVRAELEGHELVGSRIEYKRALLVAAIEKSCRGYQAEADEPVTAFWRSYWRLATEMAPELAMKEPHGKPSGAGHITFSPSRLPSRVNICHKLIDGNVDLQLKGWGKRISELDPVIGPKLDHGMNLARAEGSAAVRLKVPTLRTAESFESQQEVARAGIEAALHLLMWCGREHEMLVQINS
jgi:hypothetical protein